MGIYLKKLANPYAIFVIAWSISLYLYSLSWAGIFPKVSTSLYIFIIILILIFAVTGFLYNYVKFPFSSIEPIKLNYKILLITITILWLPNFAYSGIPLFNSVRDDNFGIPVFKVFVLSFNCFLSVYGFYLFLISGRKKYLLGVGYCLFFFVLLISRGSIIMCLSTMFFLWINIKNPIITIKRFLVIFASLGFVIYMFGVAGNLRTISDISSYNSTFDTSYSSDVILGLGDASESFEHNIIPNEFFWSYLYVTSPLSNLEYNIEKESPPFTVGNVVSVFTNEILLDAVSKRIDQTLNIEPKQPNLIVEELTVCTTLAGSYVYAGWGGMIFFIIIFWMIPLIYICFILKNPLGVIGISTLCTMFFFSMFDNMLILSGLTMQLVFPILFSFINRIKLSKTD